MSEEPNLNVNEEKHSKKQKIIVIVVAIVLVLLIVLLVVFKDKIFKSNAEDINTPTERVANEYRLSGNGLENFDLKFLQLENNEENVVYSPLSIKYALAMLKEGTKENSYNQIDALIGDYKSKKAINSANMSFANALFVKDSFKNSVNKGYIATLQEKLAAEVIFDSFKDANVLNSWVKDKTFGLIDNMYDDISNFEFILANALAIDMEWKNVIQHEFYEDETGELEGSGIQYWVSYDHEGTNNEIPFFDYIMEFRSEESSFAFNDKKNVVATEFAAAINKYDIVGTLGEDYIRKVVGDELRKWKETETDWEKNSYWYEKYNDEEKYLDNYIKEINENYKQHDYSTDFLLYDDEDVKAFAKNLKTYNNTTLQYVGIMPKNQNLKDYISKINSKEINNIIDNLKDITKYDDFEDGFFTHVYGRVPLFSFDYELDLMKDLETIGVTDVFKQDKANLSGMTGNSDTFIADISHKATIDFSNQGIKAGAVTGAGGAGDMRDGFDYIFEMPTKEIDLTFDKPYMFLIRDIDTGEVWFAGSVYNPTEQANHTW